MKKTGGASAVDGVDVEFLFSFLRISDLFIICSVHPPPLPPPPLPHARSPPLSPPSSPACLRSDDVVNKMT